MRKILSFACCAALAALSAAGLAGCGEESRTSYRMTGEYFPEERTLRAEMTVSFRNPTEEPLSALSFELWANAYREGALYSPVSELYAPSAYYDGESYGEISILSVGGGEFSVVGEDRNILSVALSEPLFPDETAKIDISFETVLAKVDHRLGAGERNIDLTGFYPQLCALGEGGFLEYVYSSNGDPFVSDCADYEVALTFPEEYDVVFNGVGDVSLAEGKKTCHMTAENVRDVAFVLGRFQTLTDEADGIPIEYHYLTDPSPERTLRAAKDGITYFSRTFGRYPFPRYVLAETDFPYGGMEYSGLALISASLQREEVPAVVAHETAHQWWYASVGSNQFEHAWQDEGLAEFSAALFLGAYPEYGGSYEEAVARSESGYRAFFSVRSQVTKEANTVMDRPLTRFAGEYEYRNVVYDKGVILFSRVREVVGDKKFFAGLNEYAAKYAGKIASPQDLIACFHRMGGNVEALFSSFTEGLCVI